MKILVSEAYKVLHKSPVIVQQALSRQQLPQPKIDADGTKYWDKNDIETIKSILK